MNNNKVSLGPMVALIVGTTFLLAVLLVLQEEKATMANPLAWLLTVLAILLQVGVLLSFGRKIQSLFNQDEQYQILLAQKEQELTILHEKQQQLEGQLIQVQDRAGRMEKNLQQVQQIITAQLVEQDDEVHLNSAISAFNQMTGVIDQIAAGAQRQAENVNTTAELVGHMVVSIEEVDEHRIVISEASDQAMVAVDNGWQAVEETIKGMTEVNEQVLAAAEQIRQLGGYSQEIGNIVQIIDDLAEQTNLLALNAAIEAARAGEHGKGFAVVADEVRKLAERSSKATKEISSRIRTSQTLTEEAVGAMEVGTGKAEKGVELADRAGNSLQEIMASMKEAAKKIQAIAQAIETIRENSARVSQTIESVAEVTVENTYSTQEMSNVSKEVNISINNLAANYRAFKERLQQIGSMIKSD